MKATLKLMRKYMVIHLMKCNSMKKNNVIKNINKIMACGCKNKQNAAPVNNVVKSSAPKTTVTPQKSTTNRIIKREIR